MQWLHGRTRAQHPPADMTYSRSVHLEGIVLQFTEQLRGADKLDYERRVEAHGVRAEEFNRTAPCSASDAAEYGRGSGGGSCSALQAAPRAAACAGRAVVSTSTCNTTGSLGALGDDPDGGAALVCESCNERGHAEDECPYRDEQSQSESDDDDDEE